MNPFDFINDITHKKENILTLDNEKDYSPFLTNRALSYHQDTVLLANEMNRCSHIDHALQHHFLLHAIRKRKRFSKWAKKSVPAKVEVIKEYYGYSDAKAEAVQDLISDETIKEMKSVLSKGGKNTK
jgi:hypothetical protein